MAQNLSDSIFAQYAHGHKQAPDATMRRPQSLRMTINNGFATITTTIFDKSIVGRKDVSVDVDVDLNRFGGMQLGISRKHLAFIRDNGTLMVMDMGSRNGSWINGERMQPSKYYELQDGAVLRLGRMKVAVEFVELQAAIQAERNASTEPSKPMDGVARETLEVNATLTMTDVQNMSIG